MPRFRAVSHFGRERTDGRHRFEHWYRDNSVYFITARCRNRFPAFRSDEAKAVVWDRLTHWTTSCGFEIWLVTLIDNHYHVLGYMRDARDFGRMMQRVHGSVAKLVNDLLPERRVPFWRDAKCGDYFDGCLRDEQQLRSAYRYTLTQGVRHGLVRDWRLYKHTRVFLSLKDAVRRAKARRALMEGVAYPRYERNRNRNRKKRDR